MKPWFSWTVAFVLLLLAFVFFYPILNDEWRSRKWESQIRQEQDPEELRAWAINLFTLHATNQNDLFVLITNSPPQGIPVSKYGPKIEMSWDTGKGAILHLFMTWRYMRARGLYIGDTNYFIGENNNWRPGIYFYTEP
jgi:hypothetical protein